MPSTRFSPIVLAFLTTWTGAALAQTAPADTKARESSPNSWELGAGAKPAAATDAAPAQAAPSAGSPAAPAASTSSTAKADAATTDTAKADVAVKAQSTEPASATPAAAAPAAAEAPADAAKAPGEEKPKEAAPPPAPDQLKLSLDNGTSIRFGVLWQAQYEAKGNSANDDLSHNFFLRRFAVILGGTVLHDFEYFIDTDFADLLKAPTGEAQLKNGPGIQTKDAFGTYRAIDDKLKIDAGLLLPPGAHNSLQAGGSILAVDFFQNTFRHNLAFGTVNNPYGRDVGLQLRGLVGGLEYRAGAFQGLRKPSTETQASSRNPFRVAGRLQYNFLDPETGYFYGGTYLGKKSVFSVGAAADFQWDEDGSYRAYAGDVFVDVPVSDGGFSAQVNVVHRNGGDIAPALPKQTAFMSEAGFRVDAIKLSPILRFEQRWGEGAAGNERDIGGGLSYWAYGHTSNLKAFYTRNIPEAPVKAFDQLNVQWQLAFY